MNETYRVTLPRAGRIPILLSVPHCGTAFPEEIRDDYAPQLIKAPDDTDWFVDELYSFAPSLGTTMISAVCSRWVIDLNRDPESKPLYTDGRIITGLCPVTTFLGEPLYRDQRAKVDMAEVNRRIDLYYIPYHNKLKQLLENLLSEFGIVLLWDCHSIRHRVRTIQPETFPDLVLGSVDEKSAGRGLIGAALDSLREGPYSVQHNHPFKGGYITRHYGRPQANKHALQLEMNKICYMDDTEHHYHSGRAKKMGELLNSTLSRLAEQLISHKD